MPTKKKSTTKSTTKAAKAAQVSALRAEQTTNKAIAKTLMYSHYSPEREILRVNVIEEVTLGSEKRILGGRDIDLPLKDLPSDLRNAVTDVFNRVAKEIGATPAKAVKPPKNDAGE